MLMTYAPPPFPSPIVVRKWKALCVEFLRYGFRLCKRFFRTAVVILVVYSSGLQWKFFSYNGKNFCSNLPRIQAT